MRALIIGSGPAGCVTGILLKRGGWDVTIVDRGIRPELVVGESLIPAVVARLRELGLEDRVAAIGRHKPGAAIAISGLFDWKIGFDTPSATWPSYAYNVHRKEFDELMRTAAQEAGCKIRLGRVLLEKSADGRLIVREPSDVPHDLLIDASGRTRVIAGTLGVNAHRGARDDVAIFSHFDKAALPHGGSIHMTVFESGWSWRIPLRDRVSVGFVLSARDVTRFGRSPQEQYAKLLKETPILTEALAGATQIESVYRYQNYQLVSDALSGPGWVMAGDAAGFVDPVFSSGVSLALNGAFLLGEALLDGSHEALVKYERTYRAHIEMWQSLVDTFYDGRFLTMILEGERLQVEDPKTLDRLKVDRRVCDMISGLGMFDPSVVTEFSSLLSFAVAAAKRRVFQIAA